MTSLLVPGLLFACAALVALRHRAWRGATLILAATTVLCGAGSDGEEQSLTVGGGGSGGSYRQVCGPVRTYQSAAVTAEYRRALSDSVEFTADVQVAVAHETNADDGIGFTVQPMVGLDSRWVGGAIGGHFGRLVLDGSSQPAFPAARLRIGPRSVFFIDGAFADHFAGAWPGARARAGLGLGLPPMLNSERWNHSILKIGVADSGAYLATEVGIGPEVMLDAFASYGNRDSYRFALGVRWRPRLGKR